MIHSELKTEIWPVDAFGMPKMINRFDFDIGAHRIPKMHIQKYVVF